MRVRRGCVNYRLRNLEEAERDFSRAVELSVAEQGEANNNADVVPNLDALRGRALVWYEMQ